LLRDEYRLRVGKDDGFHASNILYINTVMQTVQVATLEVQTPSEVRACVMKSTSAALMECHNSSFELNKVPGKSKGTQIEVGGVG
jgi:hypothetical protein